MKASLRFVLGALFALGCTSPSPTPAPTDVPQSDTSLDDASNDVSPPDVPAQDVAVEDRVAMGDAPPVDAPAADAPQNDVAADANPSAITCNAPGGSFPAIDQRCAMASDCVAVLHQTDCCGNSVAIGIVASQRASFDAAEMTCRMLFPGCGCPAQAPLADDGNRSFDMNQIGVVCRMNRCFTYVRQ